MAAFRILLVVFGFAVLFFAARFIATGERRYLNRALWLVGAVLASGLLFFAVLLISRFA